MKHAEVKVGDYTIPLISVPMASTLEKCDKCLEEYGLGDILFYWNKFYCPKCFDIYVKVKV